VSHHLNPLTMDSLRRFISFVHELLGITILPLHGMYDNVSPSPSTSRLAFLGLGKVGCQSVENALRLKEKVTCRHTFHEVGEW
jgi:hypothetical protein